MDKKYLSSNDNKGYLWKMLHENGVFINIDNKFVQDIKNKFEIIVSNIEHSISNGTVEPNLLICNKQIIEQMLNVLKTYKNTPNNAPNNAPNNVPNNSPHNTSHNTQYSRLNNDNNTFEKQLKEKEAAAWAAAEL